MMGDTTQIAWCDITWNPVTGCTRVSPGCENCYIDWSPPFRIEGRHFRDRDGNRSHAIGSTTGVRLHDDRLDWPLRKRSWRGKRVFVCSLADLFHDQVPDEFIARVFAVMALTPEVTYQVLTKRPARMRALLTAPDFYRSVRDSLAEDHGLGELDSYGTDYFPLINVWLGVTVEDQAHADQRIPILLGTPAAVRWLSVEPMLGRTWLPGLLPSDSEVLSPIGSPRRPRIDWVVVGGESGKDARPMREEWARDVVAQCRAAGGVPVFVKQMGAVWAREHGLRGKAHDLHELPADLRIREMPGGGA